MKLGCSLALLIWSLSGALPVHRSALNDFQRSEGRELVLKSWNADRLTLLPGITLEECAKRCTQSQDCRAFNYEFRPSVICKHLPWVGDGDNAEVKRNVNCDLYEMKVRSFSSVTPPCGETRPEVVEKMVICFRGSDYHPAEAPSEEMLKLLNSGLDLS
ncbi:hypothetical protein NFI96_007592 [Prochilodus magdalenae]|nr:hypothetical protein NFI96_007592 [Prochilodus magdalenae]